MNSNEPDPEEPSPLQRVFATASIVCFASLMIFYWVARPVIELLEVRWIECMVYSTIPITVTFIILYRSCWHQEIIGAARTCALLLLSGVVLGGVVSVMGIMLLVLMFCSLWFSNGFGGHP